MFLFSSQRAVMPALVAGIHVFLQSRKGVDGRNKSGHDGRRSGNFFAIFVAAFLAFFLTLLLTAPAHAVQPDEILKDPAQEARARALSGELRCLVCQNQSIDDSDAPLAKDLRLLVRERIVAGDTDAQVKSFLVQRYGEFVLLKPPLSISTVILWLTPLLLLLGGLVAIARARQTVSTAASPASLTEAEQKALAARLENTQS